MSLNVNTDDFHVKYTKLLLQFLSLHEDELYCSYVEADYLNKIQQLEGIFGIL